MNTDIFLYNLRSLLDDPAQDPNLMGWMNDGNGFYVATDQFMSSQVMSKLCHSATKFGSFRK